MLNFEAKNQTQRLDKVFLSSLVSSWLVHLISKSTHNLSSEGMARIHDSWLKFFRGRYILIQSDSLFNSRLISLTTELSFGSIPMIFVPIFPMKLMIHTHN